MSNPTPKESAAADTTEDPLRRIHRLWKEECEALGYDVDKNREAALSLVAANTATVAKGGAV